MRKFYLATALVLFATTQAMAAEDISYEPVAVESHDAYDPSDSESYSTSEVAVAAPPCEIPTTKVYRIKPGYCPQKLVCMIPQAVGRGGCGCECGPYGIPPIYASGQNVLVRQTPEMQERITEFLTEMGALVLPKAR